eukprot:9492889-Pyramimonas_sp.AAC.2
MDFEAERLCSVISQRLAFVNTQVGAGMPEAVLLQAQANSLLATFSSSTGIALSVATQVAEHINRGPWSADQKLMLATALNDNAAAQELAKRVGHTRCQQHCSDLSHFLTASDWSVMKNAMMSEGAKAQTLGARMWRMGITCPAERTLKAAAAIIVACTYSDLSQVPGSKKAALCDMVQDAVKSIDKSKTYPHGHQKDFMMPSDLTPAKYRFAYPDAADPPVVVPADVDMSGVKMCRRKTSSQITGAPLKDRRAAAA